MSIVPTVPISVSIFYENGVVNQFFGNIQKAKPLCELRIDLLRRLDIDFSDTKDLFTITCTKKNSEMLREKSNRKYMFSKIYNRD